MELPNSEALKAFAAFFNKELLSDVNLVLTPTASSSPSIECLQDERPSSSSRGSSKVVPAHRIVLSSQSPFFLQLFSSGMSETFQKEINLDVPSVDTFMCLLRYMYTQEFDFKSDIFTLFEVADQFQVNSLKHKCELELAKSVDLQTVCKTMDIAASRSAEALLQHCAKFIIDRFETIVQDSTFYELSADNLAQIIASDDLQVRSESYVFHAVEKWLSHHHPDQLSHELVEKVIQLVRFPTLDINFLLDVVMHSPFFVEQHVVYKPILSELVLEALAYKASHPERRKLEEAKKQRTKKRSPKRIESPADPCIFPVSHLLSSSASSSVGNMLSSSSSSSASSSNAIPFQGQNVFRFRWVISDFSRRENQNFSEDFVFSVGYKGRMQLRKSSKQFQQITDSAVTDHVSLFLKVSPETQANISSWFLQVNFRLQIVNQVDETKHHFADGRETVFSSKAASLGWANFLPFTKLSSPSFLVNDCMIVEALIEISNSE